MGPESKGEVTRLIFLWKTGDKEAENRLFELVYEDLRKRARGILDGEHDKQSLGSAGLVNLAYLEFERMGQVAIHDRSHFLNFSSGVMRRLVIDRARKRDAKKRGGDMQLVPFEIGAEYPVYDRYFEVLQVSRALEIPNLLTARQEKVLDMLYFSGYTVSETALLLGVASKTVDRDFKTVRARLKDAIMGSKSIGDSDGPSPS